MNSKFISFLLIATVPLFCIDVYSQGTFPPTKQDVQCGHLDFSTIVKELYSGVNEKKNLVINKQKEWDELWKNVYSIRFPQPKLPTINFEKESVICVFAGEFYSGGYTIEVLDVKKKISSIEIQVKFVTPASSCIVSSALSQPLHLIRVKKINKKVVFKQINEITICNE